MEHKSKREGARGLELARGRFSKLLPEIAIDLWLNLIVKTSILLMWIYFTLRIARSNPSQVFTLKRFVSSVFLSHHIVVLFTFLLLCMI